MGRNTQILEDIINVLHLTPEHLAHLEQHFSTRLIHDAGNVETVATFARRLRLRVETHELGAVLDYIQEKGMAAISLDDVEQAINEFLGEDRFIEPGE